MNQAERKQPPAPPTPDAEREDQAPLDEELEHLLTPQGAELTAHIERVIFHNQENGWTVARVRVLPGDRAATVVGNLAEPNVGMCAIFRGGWVDNPTYGEQFKFESYEPTMPAEVTGIREYLKSGLIKGVGDHLAQLIVDTFGEETPRILDQEPERLTEIKGIGRKNAARIKEAWDAHKEIQELMVFLRSHEVSTAYAVRIFKFYGARALSIVRENPYRMALDIPRVGFLTADKIAAKLGFAPDSSVRAEAGAYWVLSQATDEGHVHLPRQELVGRACRQLMVPDAENQGLDPESYAAIVEQAIDSLAEQERVILENWSSEGECVFLPALFVAERGLARRLTNLLARPKAVKPKDPQGAIAKAEAQEGITLAGKQAEAVRQAAEAKVLVVTGGPGTGKTTIIKAILTLFERLGATVLLAAPTGRAAKRMAEATNREARTIHRLLEYNPQEGGFVRNEDYPLSCAALIVDEASMLDTVLAYNLVRALPETTTLILVGDVNQLPSVGPGNVLGDVIGSEAVPVVELTEIFRQARESSIIVGAHEINAGRVPDLSRPETGLTDFYFIERPDPEEALALMVEMVATRIPGRFGFDAIEDIQVLTPMHKGLVGAENLNLRLQEALNPEGPAIRRGQRVYRLGDKVMQVRNNYDHDIFNGDIGRIVAVDNKEKGVTVSFDGRDVELAGTELDEIVPAYAISVHKSQGSEYTAVVVPVLTQHYIMLQRNLLYTAVTRGKQLVVLVGTRKALNIAVARNETGTRCTRLLDRLQGGL